MAIQVLSEIVAAQIAAGEVVERPASVVKELIENALDAGAKDIRIEVEDGGRSLIRVSDDGHGIGTADVELAFHRHATSKITTVQDLNQIRTLGFRGEALHSIASVCRLTLTTRHPAEPVGTRIRVEGGTLHGKRQIGAPPGTVLTIEDLFYNTPARLKFLKSETTERRQITSLVTSYAMAYPQVRFSLHHGGRETFRTFGTGALGDVLVKALGADTFRDMLEVTPLPPRRPDLPPIDVRGYTSTPNHSRANRSHITLFVNGRAIRDSSLAFAVTQAYHTLLPKGRYPIAVLMIDMPPEEVDVNVHPTKAEVRFRSADAVFSALQHAVRSAVVEQSPAPSFRPDSPPPTAADGWQQRRQTLLRPGTDRPPAPAQHELDLDLESPGRFGQHRASEQPLQQHPANSDSSARIVESESGAIPDGPERPSQPRTLPMLRVMGQAGASYIIAEGPAGLYLIDQHAAHERILFEQFMAEQATHNAIGQKTLEAVTVELSMESVALIEENLETLHRLGFELEPFGGHTVLVRAVPAILASGDPVEAVRLIIEDLEVGAQPAQEAIEKQIALRVCKVAAVKAGQILSMTEMQALIRQLERSHSPHTCPHGRPTLIHISASQLEREFGRT